MPGQTKARPTFDALALWILFSSWCTLSGWVLSLAGALNLQGYAIVLIVFLGALAVFGRPLLMTGERLPFGRGGWLQGRRLLPKIWLALTLAAFVGGLCYHDVNYDHLTYRFPRLLFWCWEQRWYWIPTYGHRMNYSGTGFEWLMAPQFLLFHTDRLFFLINFVSFLFLPGLIFSVFRHLGISPRLSWWWMWVLPCGYCYILQATGAGNDSFATVYLLAALHYVFKAGATRSSRHLVLSLLAIGLLTGAKASNLPLVLPWLAAVFFNRRQLFGSCRPLPLAFALIFASLVSFLPMALLNIHFTGSYTGDPANSSKLQLSNPVSGIAGNALQFAVDNLSFPLWYKPISWEGVIPARIEHMLQRDYPRLQIKTGEMQLEENAGVGLGVSACAICMIFLHRRAPPARSRVGAALHRPAVWIGAAAWVALLVYMSKMGSESASRLIAAYYPLCLAGILIAAPPDGAVIRRALCRTVAALAMLSAAPLIVLNPSRPLFPVGPVLNFLAHSGVSPDLIRRGHEVYDIYAARYDGLKDLRTEIPATEKTVGFVHLGDDPEVSLWLPFGSRRVIDLWPEQSLEELRALDIHYVVVDDNALSDVHQTNLDNLLDKWHATLVTQKELVIKIQRGSERWSLIRCP